MDEADKEVEVRGKENLTGKLEEFTHSPELREIFKVGISNHIEALKKENQPTEDEIPDITKPLEVYSDLDRVVDSSFEGLTLRHFRFTSDSRAHISLARKEDFQKDDFNQESEHTEYEISIIKKTPLSAFGRDPAEVVDSGGYQIEITRKKVKKYSAGGIEFEGEGGFSVRVTEGGNCVGKGTVKHGRTSYESESTYDMGDDFNNQAQALTTQVDKLGIF